MGDDELIQEQLNFFAANSSGCGFAAQAAKDPTLHEWHHVVVMAGSYDNIDQIVRDAITADGVSTLSLVFPEVGDAADLDRFLPILDGAVIYLHAKIDTAENRCYRFRAKVGDEESYVSGFGPFDFMPETRRTPHTSLVMRVKPRPDYDWFLKEPDEGLVHVADMDMKGMPDRLLHRMWKNTFYTVRGILGKEPDNESAAKTTFIIPLPRAAQIDL